MVDPELGIALPGFLERRDGTIKVVGHRISLVQIADLYLNGATAGQIVNTFPSIPLSLMGSVLAFIAYNQGEVRAYCARERAKIDALLAGIKPAPTLEELRRRAATLPRLRPGTG